MTDVELDAATYAHLKDVARQSAGRVLTMTGFARDWEDVAVEAIADYVSYAKTHTVENPEGLVWTIANRKANRYRDLRERDRRNAPIDGGERSDAMPEGARELERRVRQDPTMSGHVARRETIEALRCALSELTDGEREIAERFYFADPPQGSKEIADSLGVSDAAVRKRLERVRRKLADIVEAVDSIDDTWTT